MRAALLATAIALACRPPAWADEITDQLDQARGYYQEGDLTGAISELEFVLQALRGRIGQELLATFPPPPAGWTVETADDGPGRHPVRRAGHHAQPDLPRAGRRQLDRGAADERRRLPAGTGRDAD